MTKMIIHTFGWFAALGSMYVALSGFGQITTCYFSMSTGNCQEGCITRRMAVYSPQCVQVATGCCIGLCEVFTCYDENNQVCNNPAGFNRWHGTINPPNPNKVCPDSDWTNCDVENIPCEDPPPSF